MLAGLCVYLSFMDLCIAESVVVDGTIERGGRDFQLTLRGQIQPEQLREYAYADRDEEEERLLDYCMRSVTTYADRPVRRQDAYLRGEP